MGHYGKVYIDGAWIAPSMGGQRDLINPTTEEPFATFASGSGIEEVNKAVAAARRAFKSFSQTSSDERAQLIERIIEAYERRSEDIADVMAQEVGVPKSMKAQVGQPVGHMKVARDLVKTYHFESRLADTIIRREPIGVCALINPWNWPVQTPLIKLIYAIAAGCTSVLKPSEASPASFLIIAEIMHAAGTPPGVFNLITGKGSVVGEALASHPHVDFVSFTGSTQAGAKVGEAAARTVKRVCLELGGKSANIVLADANLEKAARWTVQRCFSNAGQSCHAPSRMLVHQNQVDAVIPHLVDEVNKYVLGDPRDPRTTMGPLVNSSQFESVQQYIQQGVSERGRVVVGGAGRPTGLNRGYFTQPTVFVGVAPDMTIAKEEILRSGSRRHSLFQRERSHRYRQRFDLRPRRVRLQRRSQTWL